MVGLCNKEKTLNALLVVFVAVLSTLLRNAILGMQTS
jgi:hypothetical protein